jgi:hypothetical protein
MLVGIPPFVADTRDELITKIRKGRIKYPGFLGKQAKALLKALLQPTPEKRLGWASGVDEIKSHKFFAELDWEAVRNRTYDVFKPPISHFTGPTPTQNDVYGVLKDTPAKRLRGWSLDDCD